MTIDLNADVGEGAGADERIFPCLTSANVACGGHAGDRASMAAAVRLALRWGVAVGAHPGFARKEDFGRTERAVSAEEVKRLVREQVSALMAVAAASGARVSHVKPHGALYNQAARDAALAGAIAEAVAEVDATLVVFGLAGSASIAAAEARGLRAASEAFADRRYLASGALVPRSRGEEAMIHDEAEAVAQVLSMVREGWVRAVTGEMVPVRVDTVCLHGDSPFAARLAERIRQTLERTGCSVRSYAAS